MVHYRGGKAALDPQMYGDLDEFWTDPETAYREQAARYVPLDQLALSPQCGFSSTVHGNEIALESQSAKLKLVVETAREVWGAA